MYRQLRNQSSCRRGQALIEFSIVAFVLTLLLGAIIMLGYLFFSANVLQQAADVGAMELARTPLPPTAEFPDLGSTGRSSTDPTATGNNFFADATFRAEIFDERFLVVEVGGPNLNAEDLRAGYDENDINSLLGRMPLINRLLYSIMIYEEVNDEGVRRRVIRYPGALVRNSNSHPDTGVQELTVLIPRVTSRDQVPGPVMTSETGRETGIAWYPVIEEIRDNSNVGPFSLTSPVTGIDPGMAALRINYPFQSGAVVAYQYERSDGSFTGASGDVLGEDVLNHPVTAIDGEFDPPTPYELVVAANDTIDGIRAHSGRYGLGHLEAYGKQVRPYRKVISAQAIYRREVFGN